MSISSVLDYNTLKADIISAVADYSVAIHRKYSNGVVGIYDRIRYLLLIRHCKYIHYNKVYETHVLGVEYVVGNFVIDNDIYYVCVQDIPAAPDVAVTNEAYWHVHISFTYDYDTILSTLDKINRICGTKFEI